MVILSGNNPDEVCFQVQCGLNAVKRIQAANLQPALVISGTSVMYALENASDVSIYHCSIFHFESILLLFAYLGTLDMYEYIRTFWNCACPVILLFAFV